MCLPNAPHLGVAFRPEVLVIMPKLLDVHIAYLEGRVMGPSVLLARGNA